MAEVPGSAQDSGVETEGDQESNDSSMSSVSVGHPPPAQQPQQQLLLPPSDAPSVEFPPISNGNSQRSDSFPPPEPSTSGIQNTGQVSQSVAEDGYLGDCSSDGGNEKNFPMPAECFRRLVSKKCGCHPPEEIFPAPPVPPPRFSSSEGRASATCSNDIEPPAGIAFQNVRPETMASSLGYQVLAHRAEFDSHSNSNSSSSRKMRSSLKSKFLHHHSGTWSHLKASIIERKIRIAANTNNTEALARLLESKVANINVGDEHNRTALHFSAAKGYSDVVRLLLQHGADPNRKDALGNTALHLAACTNHIEVVTLLLRAGTNVSTLDKYGRTPMQLAQSKLKILQKSSNSGDAEMSKVKAEVVQVLDMMKEYLNKTGHDFDDLLNSFSHRLTLHQTHQDIHSELQSLLDSLGNLDLKKEL